MMIAKRLPERNFEAQLVERSPEGGGELTRRKRLRRGPLFAAFSPYGMNPPGTMRQRRMGAV